jgi:putative spermidine/putrescine transport system permease protein
MGQQPVTRWLSCGVNVFVYAFILAPILVIIPVSFSETQYLVFPPQGFSLRWYVNFFKTRELTTALGTTLHLAFWTTLSATVAGTMVAMAIVRYRFRGRETIRTLLMAPIVMPRLVLGIAFLLFFSKTVLSGAFGALLAAHLVIALPYVIRTVGASLLGLDRSLEEAALSLGATPLLTFRTITLPLLKPGILAGAIFAFVTSFDELVVSLFLTGPNLTTLPVQIYNYIEYTSDPTIAAISVVLIVFTSLVVLITERIVGFGQFV